MLSDVYDIIDPSNHWISLVISITRDITHDILWRRVPNACAAQWPDLAGQQHRGCLVVGIMGNAWSGISRIFYHGIYLVLPGMYFPPYIRGIYIYIYIWQGYVFQTKSYFHPSECSFCLWFIFLNSNVQLKALNLFRAGNFIFGSYMVRNKTMKSWYDRYVPWLCMVYPIIFLIVLLLQKKW